MSRVAAEPLREALKLPTEARAALIDSRLESLDVEKVDEDAEQAWRQEIQRRPEEIDGKTLDLISWPDARNRLQPRLRR